MKKFNRGYVLLYTAIIFGSCSHWIAPPFTNVIKLTEVQVGMTLAKVNETLGIEPYDIYSTQDDGTTIFVYNYRIKDRKMTITGNYSKQIHSENALKDGSTWYTDYSKVYILFQDNRMKSLVTDKGKEDADFVMLSNNNIKLISKDNLVSLLESTNSQDVLIMNEKNEVKSITSPTSNINIKSVVIPVKSKTEKNAPEIKGNALGWKIATTLGWAGTATFLILFLSFI